MGRWTSTLEAAAGSPQRAGAARGRRRQSDGGVRARDAEHHGERGDRAWVGPGVAGRREWRRGERRGELTAHWGRRGSRTLLVSRFGRSHVVRGRLRTTEGAPIANAALDVVSKTTAVNARELAKRTGPRTGTDGRVFVVLPRGVSSRDLTFRYRSHANDTIATASAERPAAGARRGAPAHPPAPCETGQAIRFSGRLLGGPLPRGGKQLVLMARASRGAWVRFNVVRTDLHGRFRSVYRFRQPGAARYRFRALSLTEAAYPYLAGGSNVVTVRKRLSRARRCMSRAGDGHSNP